MSREPVESLIPTLLIPSLDTNYATKRLHSLVRDRGIDLISYGLRSFVAEFFGLKSINLLSCRLSGASKHNPLQRDN